VSDSPAFWHRGPSLLPVNGDFDCSTLCTGGHMSVIVTGLVLSNATTAAAEASLISNRP
jgi:hypothetical protein